MHVSGQTEPVEPHNLLHERCYLLPKNNRPLPHSITGLFLQAHVFQTNLVQGNAHRPKAPPNTRSPRLDSHSGCCLDSTPYAEPLTCYPCSRPHTQGTGINILHASTSSPSKQNFLQHLLNHGKCQRCRKAERKMYCTGEALQL